MFRTLAGPSLVMPGLHANVLFANTPLFALPSSSGAASAFTALRLAAWHELAAYLARDQPALDPL